MPNGSLRRIDVSTFSKLTNMRLRRLRPQVDRGRVVLDRPDERLEHQVERARLGELAAARRSPGRRRLSRWSARKRLLAVPAVDHRVGEGRDVAARLPDARVHDDRRVDADDVVALLHHRPPPGALDVVLHLDAQRAVVPEAADAAVDLAAGEDEAAPLAQRDEGIELQLRPFLVLCHLCTPISAIPLALHGRGARCGQSKKRPDRGRGAQGEPDLG